MDTQKETHEDIIDYSFTFGGVKERVVAQDFKGGKIRLRVGGVELDLMDAKMQSGSTAELELDVTFGGVALRVPSTWAVKASLEEKAGGFENDASPPKGEPEGTLRITGKVTFGGVTVTN